MKVKLSELRSMIRKFVQEMKLGVAEPNPPDHYFSNSMLDEEDPMDRDISLKGIIGKHSNQQFQPDLDAYIANQDRINKVAVWNDDDDDDLEGDLEIGRDLFGSWKDDDEI